MTSHRKEIKLVTILILSSLIGASAIYECCKDDFCSPPQAKVHRFYVENEVLLPEVSNGCLCKVYPRRYLKCFGRNTCQNIPRNLNMSLPEFRITTTNIKVIQKEDFVNYPNITKLDIENHNNLKVIEDYSFSSMKDLTNMSISFNPNLTHLSARTFAGLLKLRELYLLKNGFNNIASISEALSPKYLPSLYDLVLKENFFEHIKSSDFQPMTFSPLKKLNIDQCRIKYIDSDSLNVFQKLEILNIGLNWVNVDNLTNLISNLTQKSGSLKTLNLYATGLKDGSSKELLKVIGNSSIACLSLAGNQFEVITKDTFPVMNNIKLLNLRDTSAQNISSNAFSRFASLQTLLLSNNKFSTIPDGAIMNSLVYLDISSFSRYKTHDFYFTIYNFTFASMNKLRVLNLSFNTLQTIYKSTFFGLSNLNTLSLKKCDIFFLEAGCFLPLQKLQFLDLEYNHFAISKFRPLDTNMFEGLENLNILLLGGNKISYLSERTFSSLKSLTHLSLNDNKLTHVEFTYFSSLNRLNVLDLQKNLLTSWTTRLFGNIDHLSHVYLGNNKITNLSAAMLEDISKLSVVDLSNNNFLCDCELYSEFTQWEHETEENVDDVLQKISALCFPSERPLLEFLKDPEASEDCEDDLAAIIICASTVFVIFVLIGSCIYYYRWNLRYYLFLVKLYFMRKGNKDFLEERASHTNYEFDAFVSYSNEDSSFVVRLVSMLENFEPHLKLCVYERDFKIGSVISESILESVIKSRKILLVISDSYAKSQWCLWETHIAHHCNLFLKNSPFKDDSLIVIKLGPVSQKHMTPTLKYILKTKVYLQWDEDEAKQEYFWRKLRENLSKKKSNLPMTRL